MGSPTPTAGSFLFLGLAVCAAIVVARKTSRTRPGGGAAAGRCVRHTPGAYPMMLPPVAPNGVRNDLPSPYHDGVEWGELPAEDH